MFWPSPSQSVSLTKPPILHRMALFYSISSFPLILPLRLVCMCVCYLFCQTYVLSFLLSYVFNSSHSPIGVTIRRMETFSNLDIFSKLFYIFTHMLHLIIQPRFFLQSPLNLLSTLLSSHIHTHRR